MLKTAQLAQIVRGLLIHVVIDPIGKQQVGMPPPADERHAGWIIFRIIINRDFNRQFGGNIPVIFLLEGQRVIFRVPGDKDLAPIAGRDDIYPGDLRFSQDTG